MKKYFTIFILLLLIYLLIWSQTSTRVENREQRQARIEFCPSGWKRFGQDCFIAFYQLSPLRYKDTIVRCHEAKGWPAVVATNDTNTFVHRLMAEQGAAYGPAFIGLVRNKKTGEFEWHDGTPVNFSNWAKRDSVTAKNQNCVVVGVKKWATVSCEKNSTKRYICQRSIQNIAEAALHSPQSSLSDPGPGVGEFTEEMYHSSLVSGKRRGKKGFMTIAIPTMARRSGPWYLGETLDSLIKHSSQQDKNQTVIVIFLSDLDPNLRSMLNRKLLSKYKRFFKSGFLQTIQAPIGYYPTFKRLKTTYKHPMKQIVWRAKQSYDFAYVMQYSHKMADYYLQLEDDVITVPDYLPIMKAYIAEINKKAARTWWSGTWACLEFSELGFIAKLFHSFDILKLASMMKLFYNEQPNDVVFLHFNELMLQFKRYLRVPTIFQHRGFISSLDLREQPLIDVMFSPNASVNDSSSDIKSLLPVVIRRTNDLEGPEQELWEKRKKMISDLFCNSKQNK